MGFFEILTLFFEIFKIFGIINWSWWVVFSPVILLVVSRLLTLAIMKIKTFFL